MFNLGMKKSVKILIYKQQSLKLRGRNRKGEESKERDITIKKALKISITYRNQMETF